MEFFCIVYSGSTITLARLAKGSPIRQRRRPPPVADEGRSCWGRGQQDTSTILCAKWMLGAATRTLSSNARLRGFIHYEHIRHRQHHPTAAGSQGPDPGRACRNAFCQRQDHFQVGDCQGSARYLPAGTAGCGPGGQRAGADAGRTHHQPEPGSQPAAEQALRLPPLRQCAPRHRAGCGELLRHHPACRWTSPKPRMPTSIIS